MGIICEERDPRLAITIGSHQVNSQYGVGSHCGIRSISLLNLAVTYAEQNGKVYVVYVR